MPVRVKERLTDMLGFGELIIKSQEQNTTALQHSAGSPKLCHHKKKKRERDIHTHTHTVEEEMTKLSAADNIATWNVQ